MIKLVWRVLLLGSVLIGPAIGQGTPGAAAILAELPLSFAGTLPCADCPGIRYQLNLLPDQVYFLRMTYLDRGSDAVFDDLGRWILGSDRQTLLLRGSREAPLFLRIDTDSRLTMLDRKGLPIESELNYALDRAAAFLWFDIQMPVRGMYRYMADAGRFVECLTGQSWPVAQDAANAEVEREYSKVTRQAGEPLLMTAEGRLRLQAGADGGAPRPTLTVEQFLGFWPGETCGTPFVQEPLAGTYWKLTRLGDQPVSVREDTREPHLLLREEGRRLTGWGGCNRLIGSYELQDQMIAFGGIAGTRMICPDGDATEPAFLAALAETRQWKVLGQHLEFYDAEGQLTARFEARHLE